MQSIQESFKHTQTCVLVPTYNNAGTLKSVLDDVLQYTAQVLVVNDGSTDQTAQILKDYQNKIHLMQYAQNLGKGYALKTGFRKAYELGYQYAITIDSDGQHFPSDLPKFIEAIQQNPGALIIGARNLNQENVPQKSSFGNKFSNFWFWAETGIRLPDTQSGYRAYPLAHAGTMRYFTRKYELEIEAPVRMAWRGVPVISIPISVYYPPASERVSHFRPFKDFGRISVLNTFLFFIAILWIHPRNFFLRLTSREGLKSLYRSVIQKPEESNARKAASIGFGVFMGIVPVWGFQLLIGIPLAIYFKLNKALFLLAAHISVAPLVPFWIALSVMSGKWILGYRDWSFRFRDIDLEQLKQTGAAFFLGGTVLALVLGLLAFLVSFYALKMFRKSHHIPEA